MTPKISKVRDPIHGFITLQPRHTDIVNTPVFQRMRRIRQLAWANLVYPGANHTRFCHTLGVFHVASLMAEALELKSHEREIVEFAALLHDLGHGPFSHVSESVLERFAKPEAIKENQKQDKIHELVTEKIILSNDKLIDIIGKNTIDVIINLLKDGLGQKGILRHIVSGPLDADKQDYLLRDSYFCGVDYGDFDMHQLHRELGKNTVEGDDRLCVGQDGLHTIEQFVMAKYYMTCQIYRHKIRTITDQMLTRALVLGIIEDQIEELNQLYSYDGSDAYIRNFLEWDDDRLVATFTDKKHRASNVGQLLTRLQNRDLFKRVFSANLATNPTIYRRKTDLPVETLFTNADNKQALRDIRSTASIQQRRNLEGEIAGVIEELTGQPMDPNFVIVHQYGLKSVREQSKNGEGSIQIQQIGEAKTKPFEQVSTVFRSINEELEEHYIEVYAPVNYEQVASREELLQKLHDPILGKLFQILPVQ